MRVAAAPPPRSVVAALGVTQIVSWGVLYYAFPVLAVPISADTGWSMPAVTGAFTLGLITAALVGIPVGRILDKRGPWLIMTCSSALATVAVLGVATATHLGAFIAAWLLAGISMSGTLYPPAFAAVTRWFPGSSRVRALTALTLAGGLASTVFAPLTATLAEHFDWRGAYLLLATVLAAVTLPIHLLCLRRPWPALSHSAPARDRSVVYTRTFLMLAAAFTLSAFALYSVVISLVPLLTGRGASLSVAAWALALGGIGQVIGRVSYGLLARRVQPVPRTVAVFALGGATTALLGATPGPIALLVAIAMIAGAARGISTLLQATAVTERLGTARYGALSAALGAPVTVAIALAPWASASVAAVIGGYVELFGALAVVSFTAAALAAATRPVGP